MKFCKQCGAQISADTKFCVRCGKKCSEGTDPYEYFTSVPEKKTKISTKSKVIAILSIVLVLSGLIIGAFFGVKWYFSAEQRLIRALEDGNLELMLEIIEEDASLKNSITLTDQLQDRIEGIKNDYEAEAIGYQDAMLALNNIWKIDIEELRDEMHATQSYIYELNDSRVAFRTAENFFADGKYIEAISKYKQVIRKDSNYDMAKAKISEVENLYREEVLTNAAMYAQNSEYPDAIAVLDAALIILPNDIQITQQMHLYEKAYENQILADTLEKASTYAATGDYLTAISILRNYTDAHGTITTVAGVLNNYIEAYVNDVLIAAESKKNSGDFREAIKIIQTGCVNAPNNVRLSECLDIYSMHYASEIVAHSETMLAEEDYVSAMNIVREGLTLLPENQMLLSQNEKIERVRPKNLIDACAPFGNGYTVYSTGKTFRMAGEARTNGITIDSGDNMVMFSLNGQYKEVTFYAGHLDNVNMNMGRLQIYLDGELYESYEFRIDSPIVYVKISVVGVKQLKIYATDNMGLNTTELGCADMIIQ